MKNQSIKELQKILQNLLFRVSSDSEVIKGHFRIPAQIYVVKNLLKTRSGEVMRRLLRKLSLNETELGDTSTLVYPFALECNIGL